MRPSSGAQPGVLAPKIARPVFWRPRRWWETELARQNTCASDANSGAGCLGVVSIVRESREVPPSSVQECKVGVKGVNRRV